MSQSPAEDAHSDQGDVSVSTGDSRVDEALRTTESLDDLDVAEHPAAFEHVHRVLRDSLAGTPPTSDEGQRE
ncbi:hypothetical protein [Aeromicrobium sp. CF3.5]|uniref:hypothetical protein n=1 Tax=Aeromicrobium sp. CF3.5 TaxID=3373078 RepID=UPI003EE5C72A